MLHILTLSAGHVRLFIPETMYLASLAEFAIKMVELYFQATYRKRVFKNSLIQTS
jgi:hypothetical protein